MRKRLSARQVLSDNLKKLMAADPKLSSGPKVASGSGITRKTINNLAEDRHDPRLGSIEAVGKAFGLEVYQLLLPELDANLLAIFRAYSETDDSGRNLLRAAAETVQKARERNRKTGSDE